MQVNWPAVSAAVAYNVYRSLGACPGTAFVQLATVASPSFLDTTVSGGVDLQLRGDRGLRRGGGVRVAALAVRAVVPTGDCFVAPSFAGLASAASAGRRGLRDRARPGARPAPACAGDVRYNVYRGTTSTFTPGPANRIARCVAGTSFTDSVDLAFNATRWYVVRAEDATTGHGGPCRGGNEESNTARGRGRSPTAPRRSRTWSDDAGDTGTAKLIGRAAVASDRDRRARGARLVRR